MSPVARRAAWALLAILTAAYAAWTWSDELTTMRGDSAVYLLTARHYAFWAGLDPIAGQIARESQFPPMYSVLLSWTGAGSGDHAVRWANLTTVVLSLAGWIALLLWLLRLGLPGASSIAIVCVAALLPNALKLALNAQSEHLYVPLALTALIAMEEYRRTGRREAFQFAALVVGAAMLTRTIATALLVPLLLLALRSKDRRLVLATLVAVIPALAWKLVHRPTHAYAGIMAAFYRDAPLASTVDFLAAGPLRLLNQLADNLAPGGGLRWLTVPLAAGMGAAAVWRALRWTPDGLYVLAYVGIVLVWPYPGEGPRFLLVIVPIMMGQATLAISALGANRPALTLVLPLALLAISIPNVVHTVRRYGEGLHEADARLRSFPEWYDLDVDRGAQRARLLATHIDGMRRVPQFVGESECVLNVYPVLLAYYAHRRSVEPPMPATSDAVFQAEIDSSPCRHVFLMTVVGGGFTEPLYPLQRLAPRLQVVDTSPPRSQQPVAFLANIR